MGINNTCTAKPAQFAGSIVVGQEAEARTRAVGIAAAVNVMEAATVVPEVLHE